MLKAKLRLTLKKVINYLNFAINFFLKRNPLLSMAGDINNTVKDTLSIYKKAKMAKYRVSYQEYQFAKMEKLIAQNNQHYFLSGRKIDQKR